MMNMKAMHKDFWMEIRKSKARFISIFMIVALGVAFFSGIQASSPDMRFSGDAYYDETNLMDIKVVGSLGLTEDDVAAIRKVDGVENAEGAYGTDVMCGEGEKQKVLHVEAVDQTMNRISVTALLLYTIDVSDERNVSMDDSFTSATASSCIAKISFPYLK